jgi:hypothetical protein
MRKKMPFDARDSLEVAAIDIMAPPVARPGLARQRERV